MRGEEARVTGSAANNVLGIWRTDKDKWCAGWSGGNARRRFRKAKRRKRNTQEPATGGSSLVACVRHVVRYPTSTRSSPPVEPVWHIVLAAVEDEPE